jgi:hypothetical protein
VRGVLPVAGERPLERGLHQHVTTTAASARHADTHAATGSMCTHRGVVGAVEQQRAREGRCSDDSAVDDAAVHDLVPHAVVTHAHSAVAVAVEACEEPTRLHDVTTDASPQRST